MNNITYFGNSAYCYSNSTAMLLSSVGENIPPSLIEVTGVVGVGAYALPDSNISFLSGYSGLPDKAISRALRVLGFEFIEESQEDANTAPLDKITDILMTSPVVIGPLDMGYLNYDPDSSHHFGVDHYVLLTEIQKDLAIVHDPAGFPNAAISLDQLLLAWKAENISYRENYYRFWSNPKRVSSPTIDDIYQKTIESIREVYRLGEKYAAPKNRIIDVDAIRLMANNIKDNKMSKSDIGMLTGFIFPVGARRANDYADFFQKHNESLSQLKRQQSSLLGLCQLYIANHDLEEVSETLLEYSDLEKQFKDAVLALITTYPNISTNPKKDL